ncbi:hypothetical protein DYBT9275_03534 [Dyadobacter sp. CECT 9275]|uniref:DUF5723 domain-containing protein n=1 Tax=Dyadobacter helix TaxID=2822344 RepID=A0A916N6T3_9BACT|nr:DUF5723 family protein [Dyadobacter sp. CECT 9275]CAG5005193.1 hypothetical protein DYBT9275_03534 [Dyadobacter sp. CECT 9275]
MDRSFYILLILYVSVPLISQSQHLPGVAMGNYAGTNALYHNPAFVADNRYGVSINLVGTQFYTANNHVKWDAPFSFLSLITNTVSDEYRTDRGALIFPRRYLDEKLNGKSNKYLNAGGDTRLPSFMFNLFKGRVGVGFSTRARYILNTTGLTEPLARLISKTTKLEELQGRVFSGQAGQLHLNGLGEFALTLGGVVMDNETDFVKVGFTIKRLLGLYNVHAIIENSAFTVLPDASWSYRRELIGVDEINVRYAITRDEGYSNIKPTIPWLFGNAPPGSGWGFDLGAVYEYRPDINKFGYTAKGIRQYDATKNKYLYRISASLTDIGRVHFKNPAYILQQETHTANKEFRYDDFHNLKGSEAFYTAINESLEGGEPLAPNFRSVLPMAFQASIDYHLKPDIYVNTLWVQNLIPQSAFGMKAESIIAVTPRYEHKWYEVSVPLVLMNRYRSPAIGLAGRIGPLWLGTDHLTGLLNIGKPKAFNLYFGISGGLFRKPPEEQNQCWPPRKSFFKRVFSKR